MARLRPTRPVQANCRRVLSRLLRRYFSRGRLLVERQAGHHELHQFRIRTKRLRYITELYAALFPTPLRGALREFRLIQGVLGNMQDQVMVIAYFEQRLMHVRTPARQAEYQRVLHRARVRQTAFRGAFVRRWERLEKDGLELRLLQGLQKATAVTAGH